MEFSVNGKKENQTYSLQVLRHHCIWIATVKILQFLTFISNHCVFNKFYSNTFFKLMREKLRFFRKCWKILQNFFLQKLRHFLICIATVKVIQFLIFLSDHCVFNKITQMPSLNRYEKATCENCGTHTTKLKLARRKRVVLLVHSIVANVPTSPQNYKVIWTIILLRSTAPQNLISPSNVNFVMQNFPAFMLYVNTETLNMYNK